MIRYSAIVLAAGSGKRMESDTPKQYMQLRGKPLMLYCLEAFEASCVEEIIIVVAPGEIEYVKKNIVERYGLHKVSYIVEGGAERYDSVEAALNVARGEFVLIHDSARPMITADVINRCASGVAIYDSCVVGMPSKDTIKLTDDRGRVLSTPDRNNAWIVQTPQCFKISIIKEAFAKFRASQDTDITDDAMIVERYMGLPVRMLKASYTNMKVTTPEDFIIANAILGSLSN